MLTNEQHPFLYHTGNRVNGSRIGVTALNLWRALYPSGEKYFLFCQVYFRPFDEWPLSFILKASMDIAFYLRFVRDIVSNDLTFPISMTYCLQEEEILKPKQAKRRKKAISDSD